MYVWNLCTPRSATKSPNKPTAAMDADFPLLLEAPLYFCSLRETPVGGTLVGAVVLGTGVGAVVLGTGVGAVVLDTEVGAVVVCSVGTMVFGAGVGVVDPVSGVTMTDPSSFFISFS